MRKARLMNSPEDYKRLGINPDEIEVWEDGIRIPPEKGYWEWWYFDTIADDGTKVVVQFFSRSGANLLKKGYFPKFTIKVTTPDGREYSEEAKFSEKEARWSKERCDTEYGRSYFRGDLKDYRVHTEAVNGLAADLAFHSLSKPYRPGSSYFSFESDEEFFTWLCVMPKGEVIGTVTIEGKEQRIHGFGYHDHQWGNTNFLKEWNHWVWGRQNFEDYSLLIFDFVSAEKTGYTRIPILFIEDKDGNIIFENTEKVECKVLSTYFDEVSGKTYPKEIQYHFSNGGKEVDYLLKEEDIIENNGRNNLSTAKKLAAKVAGIDPAYTRYSAEGRLVIREGEKTIERSSRLIYEFMYPGASFEGHM